MKNEKKSDFGKGFVYNLILFSKHWLMFQDILEREPSEFGYNMWFTAASDHFYELEIPDKWKETEIGKLATFIQDRSLHFGHGFTEESTKKDYKEMFEKIEELAMLIDKELGIEPVKAEWN